VAYSHGDPLWVVPIKMAPESPPPPLGERLRVPNQLAKNSRLSKQIVSTRVKPPHIRRSPSVATVSVDE
jgi:hypothetical protein